MRTLAALFAAAALTLTASAAAQAPAPTRQLQALFNVHARGVDAGEFSYTFAQTGGSYEATARRRATGLARMLVGDDQDYSYSSRGAVNADSSLQPAAYQHRGGKRNRLVRATFSANDIVTSSEPRMGMGNPPATQAQRRGAIDQLSAIASMVVAQGDPCARTVRVYMDGRSRFDFVMTPNGRVNIDTAGYRGEVLRCRVQFTPIAGFSDPQEAAVLTFLFAPTQAGMFAPVRIEMPSDDGMVILEARQLTVNGTRLR